MGMFLCAICGICAESHDGGEEYKPGHPTDYKMICVDCAAEREARRELARERRKK